jgi:spore germination protein (amino acid permease)
LQKHVTNGQLFFIIFFTLTGYSVIELPKTLAESSGTGAWFTIIVTTVFFMFAASIIAYLGYMFKEKTLYEYSRLLAGKFITYIFALIYVVYFLVVLSMISRSTAEIIKADFLPKTPIWAISFIILITSYYAASKGITNLGRIFFFYGVIILCMSVEIHTIMFFVGDLINIQPLFDVSETGKYLSGTFTAILSFLGYEVLTVIPLSKKNGKKAVYYSAGAILAAGLFYIFIVESCYAVIGVDDIVNYRNSLIVAIRRIDVQFLQFLKRLDIVFIVSWLSAIFCTVNILVYTLNEYVCKLLPTKKKFIVLTAVTIIAYIGSLIPQNADVASKILLIFTGYLGLIPAFLIPLILLIIAKVKRHVSKV